MNVR